MIPFFCLFLFTLLGAIYLTCLHFLTTRNTGLLFLPSKYLLREISIVWWTGWCLAPSKLTASSGSPCVCLRSHIKCLRRHFNFSLILLFSGDTSSLLFLLGRLFVDLFLFNVGQIGMRITPKTVWLLTCVFANTNTKIPGPAKGGYWLLYFSFLLGQY